MLARVACRLGGVRDGSALGLGQEAIVSRTFREQPVLAALSVSAQKPAIAEVVVALNQLNAVPPLQAKLVRATGNKLICGSGSAQLSQGSTVGAIMAAVELRGAPEGWGDSRTTTSRSPGRQCSVWERSPEAMAGPRGGGSRGRSAGGWACKSRASDTQRAQRECIM